MHRALIDRRRSAVRVDSGKNQRSCTALDEPARTRGIDDCTANGGCVRTDRNSAIERRAGVVKVESVRESQRIIRRGGIQHQGRGRKVRAAPHERRRSAAEVHRDRRTKGTEAARTAGDRHFACRGAHRAAECHTGFKHAAIERKVASSQANSLIGP